MLFPFFAKLTSPIMRRWYYGVRSGYIGNAVFALYAERRIVRENHMAYYEIIYKMEEIFMLKLLGHLFLTSVTGGLWLVVLAIRHFTK